jgi:PBP1b-binding outer membrane lipoprotein LpoB
MQMKTIVTQNRTKHTIFAALLLSTMLFSACKVAFVPNYDDKIAEQIENIAKSVDKLYLTMLETSTEANGGRAYSVFADQYIAIEIELHSLLNKNAARKKNENTVKICEKTIELFEKYKNEHKERNTINDANIKLNLEYLRGILYPLMISEEAKRLAN